MTIARSDRGAAPFARARTRHPFALILAGLAASLAGPVPIALAQDEPTGRRQIEEVIVTAERRESTVQDTAISVTAFTSDFIKDFGLRNQEDLQNYIPATTIQPYDIAIRGVGRNFRTLGGDPGVSTYLNNIYSEDFGIASTEGALYDVDRIEVLRGPQGTLYGRNSIGGAVNFHNARPTQEFDLGARTIIGNFDTRELYGFVSGPMIKDVLAFRATGVKRERDGYINDTSPNGSGDINSIGDENYALSFEFTPTDRLTFYVRGNERSSRRRMNGGEGTHPIQTSELGGVRNTTDLVFGYREIVPGDTDFNSPTYVDPTRAITSFSNPFSGETKLAQAVRPGVDPTGRTVAGGTSPNYSFGAASFDLSPIRDRDDLKGGDLDVATNGNYDEGFDHQAVAFNVEYSGERFSLKYNFGYTDFFYDRDTDEDATGSAALGTYNFYVHQENENFQHEIQFDLDVNERISLVSGLFYYESRIDQRLDLYDPIDTQCRYQCDGNYGFLDIGTMGALMAAFVPGGVATPINNYTAEELYRSGTPVSPVDGTVSLLAPWFGDTGDSVRSGPPTPGTFFQWENTNNTEAKAVYLQGEWQMSDKFALTLGARWARDEKEAGERIFTVLEDAGFLIFPFAFDPTLAGLVAPNCPAGNLLCAYNVLNGSLDGATLEPTGNAPVRFNSVPVTFASFLPLEDAFEEWTWRANIDWTPNDNTLVYFSATTGYRSGGYNLGFRSINSPIYDTEKILSYELGYKGQLFDNTLQVNASAYIYDYEDIQVIGTVLGPFGEGVAVLNAPSAETIGVEVDVFWLATERLTIGGNVSYTDATFDESFGFVDTTNPNAPPSIFTDLTERAYEAKGNKLPRIPEWKTTWYANYSVPLQRAGTIDFNTSLSWTDSFFFTPDNNDLDKTPDFSRWDARVSWTSADSRWIVAVFGNNLTNELGVRNQGRWGEQMNFRRVVTTTDPRAYGLEVRFSFSGN
jgi:outer membrane receptor protein involved in Fe transport